MSAVRAAVRQASTPVVVDGDGLFALAWDPTAPVRSCAGATAPTVLTPHDGEYGLLVGHKPDADRIGAVRRLAADLARRGPAQGTGDRRRRSGRRRARRGVRRRAAGDGRHRRRAVGRRRCPASPRAWTRSGPPRPGRGSTPPPPAVVRRSGSSPATSSRHCPTCSRTSDERRRRAPARWAWAEIDVDAVAHNVGLLREVASPAAVWAVVKADAYGHGAATVGSAALEAGCEGLCVALTSEGVALREAGIDAPILILSEQPPDHASAIIANRLIPTVDHDDGDRVAPRRRCRRRRRPRQGRHRDAPRRCVAGRRPGARDRHRTGRATAASRRCVHPPRRRRRARRSVHAGAARRSSTRSWPRCRVSTPSPCTPPTPPARSPIPMRGGRSCAPASPSTASRRAPVSTGSPTGCARCCRCTHACRSSSASAAGARLSYGLRHRLDADRHHRHRAGRLRRRCPRAACRRAATCSSAAAAVRSSARSPWTS